MDQVTYLIVLRFIHIVTGVFWAGATIYLAWFILPAVKACGPEGGRFMQQLGNTNKLPVVMTVTSSLNVLSGILLLWKLSAGLETTFLFSKHGLVLLFGGALAILAFIEGFFVTRPAVLQMNKFSQTVAMGGKPPSEEQMQQILRFRKKIRNATNMAAFLLLLAVVAMSLIRYI
jgi:uncharacterized membrane protein